MVVGGVAVVTSFFFNPRRGAFPWCDENLHRPHTFFCLCLELCKGTQFPPSLFSLNVMVTGFAFYFLAPFCI